MHEHEAAHSAPIRCHIWTTEVTSIWWQASRLVIIGQTFYNDQRSGKHPGRHQPNFFCVKDASKQCRQHVVVHYSAETLRLARHEYRVKPQVLTQQKCNCFCSRFCQFERVIKTFFFKCNRYTLRIENEKNSNFCRRNLSSINFLW